MLLFSFLIYLTACSEGPLDEENQDDNPTNIGVNVNQTKIGTNVVPFNIQPISTNKATVNVPMNMNIFPPSNLKIIKPLN